MWTSSSVTHTCIWSPTWSWRPSTHSLPTGCWTASLRHTRRAAPPAAASAIAGAVAAVKPQSAFFEVFGSRGVALLERVLDELRAAGIDCEVVGDAGEVGYIHGAIHSAFKVASVG